MDVETLGAAIALTAGKANEAEAAAQRAEEAVANLDGTWVLTVEGTKLNITKAEE